VNAPPALARTTARKIAFQSRAVKVAFAIALVLAGLITLIVIGVDVGPVAFLTGLVLATVPVPIYVTLALRIDRYEPEPLRMLAWAFFWGASAATLIALVLNTAGQAVVGSSFGSDIGEIYGGSISAPIVEESAKGAVLFGIYRWRRTQLDGVLDGLVYAAMVGLGFAMTENILYYSRAALEGGVPLAATFFVRGVLAPFTHPIFTAMTGMGVGVAVGSVRHGVRLLAPLGGLVAAMVLHSLWNTAAGVGGGAAFLGVYFVIMVPVFLALIAVIVVSVQREGRVVAEQLRPEIAAGTLTPGEALTLSSLSDRRRMRRAARRDGAEPRRACRALQLAATELAFQRSRVARGLAPAAAGVALNGAELASALADLRAHAGPHVRAVLEGAERRAALIGALPRAVGAGPGAPYRPPAGPAPSWYADPWRQARWRWWDGAAWTGHIAD
jgi:RsiW-degrading membrane proteinase PrsW (M82 family)